MVDNIVYKNVTNTIFERELISAAFEHSVLRVWEIYVLENAVFYIAVYWEYKL